MTSSRNWEDICNEFNNKDSYNIEVDVTKRDLESTKLQPNETFSEYITRWRKRASQMTTRPLERGATGNDSEKPLARVSKAYVCPIPTRLQSSHRDRVEN